MPLSKQMELIDQLNPQQREAVTALPGAILVLAGPGSGKTRVLAHRIGYLVLQMGVHPSQIMAVTFTNKAAREMRSRVEHLLGGTADAPSNLTGINLGTFHAFAAQMIRREAKHLPITRDFVIFDENDQTSLFRQIFKEMNIDPKQIPPGKVQSIISSAKNELIEPAFFRAGSYFLEIVQRIFERYQSLLLANNALDFDDLLFFAVGLLRDHEDVRQAYRNRYRHILVDEFQDTNTAQYLLLQLLAGEKPDLFVVGDPDQSIYRWRGADYRNVHRFQEDYPQAKVFLLEQNYRSTQNILDVAMGVIDRHAGRQHKQLFTLRGPGSKITLHEAYDESDEANFVLNTIDSLVGTGEAESGGCAIMYRTNAQSRILEEAFLRAGRAYRLVGAQRFYGRREVKDLIAYLRLIHNPDDQVSFLRVINTPPRGLGEKTVTALLQAAEQHRMTPGKMLLEFFKEGSQPDQLALSSRAMISISGFTRMFAHWREARSEMELEALIDLILQDTGYQAFVDDDTEEGKERWANVMELRAVAQEFSQIGLTNFLEHVALVSDQDTLTDSQNAPTLLTLHAAKGLEFPVVFIIGLDDGIIPHQRSFDDPEAMAEERRLFYVGITRAINRLYLLRTFRRRISGLADIAEPSRFLEDLPADRLEGEWIGKGTREQTTFQQQTSWSWQTSVAQDAPRFQAGMRVVHPSFGEGIVMQSRIEQDDEEVTVVFASHGIKHLAVSMSKLEPLED